MLYDRCPGGSLFCLGMTDYNCCGTDFVPDAKKRKTSGDSTPLNSHGLVLRIGGADFFHCWVANSIWLERAELLITKR